MASKSLGAWFPAATIHKVRCALVRDILAWKAWGNAEERERGEGEGVCHGHAFAEMRFIHPRVCWCMRHLNHYGCLSTICRMQRTALAARLVPRKHAIACRMSTTLNLHTRASHIRMRSGVALSKTLTPSWLGLESGWVDLIVLYSRGQ
jgi:hypothetical protein